MVNPTPTDLVNMAQSFTGLPMTDLIGGPLMAAAEAQRDLAQIGTKYILDTGFTQQPNDANNPDAGFHYVQNDLNFKLRRPVVEKDADGKLVVPQPAPFETDITVPLLACVPVQALGVTKVDITFDMEVKSSYSNKASESSSSSSQAKGSFSAKAGWGPVSVTVKGSASYSSSQERSNEERFKKSNEAHYHVGVTAGQQPVPKGLQNIIEALTNNVAPIIIDPSTNTP